MIIAEHNLLGHFFEYNTMYFGGVLPFPKLKIRHSFRTLGYFSCEYDSYGNMFNECIEMSDNYDYTDSQFRDILVHEMIHFYLAYMGIDTRCSHGSEFRKMASEFNTKYGMNITSRIDLTPYTIKKGKSKLMFTLSTLF